MRLVEIAALENGAHRNQTMDAPIAILEGCSIVPDGWVIIPDGMETPNFPFGDITVDNQTPPVVTSWTPLPIPEPEPAHEPEPTADEVLNALLGVNT